MGQELPFRPRRPGESEQAYHRKAVAWYTMRIKQQQRQWLLICVAAIMLAAAVIITAIGTLLN